MSRPRNSSHGVGVLFARSLAFELLESRVVLAPIALGDESLVSGTIPGGQAISPNGQSVATLENQGAAVVFSGRGSDDLQGIFLRRLGSENEALGSISRVNVTRSGLQTSPAIIDSANGFVVAWSGRGSGDRHGIFARWYDQQGSPLTGEMLVNKTVGGEQRNPRLAIAGETLVVLWEGVGVGDLDGVFLRRFTSRGIPLGDETRVNEHTIDEQAMPTIGVRPDGSFIVSWSSRHQDGSDWGVFARELGSDGIPTGQEFQVNQSAANSQLGSSVAVSADGSFFVGWSSFDPQTGWDVTGRHFSASAEPARDELRINEVVEGHQREIAVVATNDRRMFAAWTSGTNDGAGWGVVAAVLSDLTDGTEEVAVEGRSSGVNAGHQQSPSVRRLDESHAIVVWSGNGVDDRDGVFARRFEIRANAPPDLAVIDDGQVVVGAEFRVEISATDPNPGDLLVFQLDRDDSPEGASIEQTSNNTATIRWQTFPDNPTGPVGFVVLVTDRAGLADRQTFSVEVLAQVESDLPGEGEAPSATGIDEFWALWGDGQGALSIFNNR